MVTTTTKTLNYAIEKGNIKNIVNATLVSTPGFNTYFLSKLPGILKIVQFVLAIIAVALIGSVQIITQPLIVDQRGQPLGATHSFPRQTFLVGEVYFLCAHTAVITVLFIFIATFMTNTLSAMVTTKTTKLDIVMNVLLGILLIAAGITEIVMTERWKWDDRFPDKRMMPVDREAIRVSAGVVALINGILFLVAYSFANKEFKGPAAQQLGNEQGLLKHTERAERKHERP